MIKRIAILAVIVFVVIIGGIFLISDTEENKTTEEKLKVGLILNGKVTDDSWGESHYVGLKTCEKDLNIKLLYEENVPENKKSMHYIEELIDKGCKIIICNSFMFGEWEKKVAEKYPNIYFLHATGNEKDKNFSSYFGRIYQARYLSGIVAGLQTKTDKIGYVAAHEIPEVIRGINAFTLGVRKVNKKAKVYVDWCNSWIGDMEAADATKRIIENHDIDVITMHTDSLKPLEIAEEEGIWSIGYNIDNSEKFPKTYLTAPIWEWHNFYKPRILECKYDKFKGEQYWEGIETGIIGLAKFTDNVKEDATEAVEKEKEKMVKGTFDVFYGPIKDNKGKTRVNKGESMSDDVMLNEFDWFVEGVVENK